LGQTARVNGLKREDPTLRDCFLSNKGIHQACGLAKQIEDLHSINEFDLVCTSPLTRAVATCVLGLGHLSQACKSDGGSIEFLCHPDLAESGGKIPENQGRPIKHVIKSIEDNLAYISPSHSAVHSIDFSLVPSTWPNGDRSMVGYFMEWLSQRPEKNIAVVCHHNVILSLLGHTIERVPNCVPIQCTMTEDNLRTLHLNTNERSSPESGIRSSTTIVEGIGKRNKRKGKRNK
jgi:broad specificity phosphatase PhoE